MRFELDDLRPLSLFEGLSDAQLAWFCERGHRIELEAGEHMFERGQPADFLFVVVAGAVEGYEEIGGQWLLVATTGRGEATGMLPFSRMTHYPRYTVAVEPSRVLRIDQGDFPEMLSTSLEVGQRLVAAMSDRVRGDVRLEQQQEKMMALGKLSAGLAHELNNPAAAVGRAAAALSEHLGRLPGCVTGLIRSNLDEAAVEALRRLPERVRRSESEAPSALERAEREEELEAWLEDHGVTDGWHIAATFVDAGLTREDLDRFQGEIPAAALHDALVWVECGLAADRMVAEIAASSERISSLIASVKVYSHMDRSAEHKLTDLREGLDNTRTMLGHKIARKSIRLARSYQEGLPGVLGNAGELNQVWTNLIDNALDAMGEGGELRIEAKAKDSGVEVRVIDNGSGIPDEVRPFIFDPFYTTKGVGEGTGLGLDIAQRIVKAHRGGIDVRSKPGRTEVRVQLPADTGSGSQGPR